METIQQTINFKIIMATIPSYLKDACIKRELHKLAPRLNEHRFWWIDTKEAVKAMFFDSNTKLIWLNTPIPDKYFTAGSDEIRLFLAQIRWQKNWCVPTKDELIELARNSSPIKSGQNFRLYGHDYWLTQSTNGESGRIDLDNLNHSPTNSSSRLLPCCRELCAANTAHQIHQIALNNNWKLYPSTKNADADLLQITKDSVLVYDHVDYLSARLPILETAQFTDPNKGLWEFWGMDAKALEEIGARARNPAQDVRDWNVAIDFGTSSTVVAYDDNDRRKLLRIGMGNFWDAEKPEHYENPTVLEFLDFAGMLQEWQQDAYRPAVLWDQVRCSHAALANFRDSKSNAQVVSSVLIKMKQWALRDQSRQPVRFTDQKGFEHELAALTMRSPVKGQPLQVGSSDPFDPIELYAWFLGLTINWRGRGIFLRYYMTFPVAYPQDVKEKILAAFRRGLQRSLPATLVQQPELLQRFIVEERASEPAAYAASALPLLGIEPTVEGTPYAVFDFGGGTTDFDYGHYRLPDAEEEDEGWEQVFEHFGAAGDHFLGGENLLENLAYQVFHTNLDVCRKKHIAFSRPLDADDFPGSEMFLDRSQSAATNTVMLMAQLRPFWESGAALDMGDGMLTLDLLTREGQKESCQLAVPVDQLRQYLEQRIGTGVENFLAALCKAFGTRAPKQIHVLLAGNSSRSRLVRGYFGPPEEPLDTAKLATALSGLFGNLSRDTPKPSPTNKSASSPTPARPNTLHQRTQQILKSLFGENPPELIAHAPLPADPKDVYRPTAKTGVALGLLKLCPGGVVKVINHAERESEGEAPFNHYVGRVRQGNFLAGLLQGTAYGIWQELGVPRDQVFNLYHTQSPKAHTGQLKEGEAGLFKLRVVLPGTELGQRVFGRATGPSRIEICQSTSAEQIETGHADHLQTIDLA